MKGKRFSEEKIMDSQGIQLWCQHQRFGTHTQCFGAKHLLFG